MTIKAQPNIRTGAGEVVKNLKIFFSQGEKNILGATVLEDLKKKKQNKTKKLKLKKKKQKTKNMTSVLCFRIWDHFTPFHVLGFGVIFCRSMF